MGKIRLTGATSGYTELKAAEAAGNNTITLPTTNGGEVIVSDSSGNVNIDSGTFYVDASNNRVGIGTSAPSLKLTVADTNNQISATTGTNELVVRANSTEAALYTFQAIPLNFYTNNATRLTIDSSGRVGIGTTSPDAPFKVATSSTSNGVVANFENSSTGALIQYGQPGVANWRAGVVSGADAFAIYGFGSGSYPERLRVDSSGRLLVGTSSAIAGKQSQQRTLQIARAQASTDQGLGVFHFDSGGQSPNFELALSKNNTLGSHTVVSSGDNCGSIIWSGSDGSKFVQLAQIAGAVDGTPGADDMPGRLVFSTTADGASSPTERMRIQNNGQILFNTTSQLNAGFISLLFNGSTHCGHAIADDQTSGDYIRFFRSTSTQVGSITHTSSATAYNTSSDYRLKENIEKVTGAISRLQALKPCRFNFIADPDIRVDGFIAHEVQDIVPEAIHGIKDEVDANGNPIYQGIDQSKLVPLLTAALQEAIGEIESLKTRVAVLESA